eukprot:COSAG01_NODE_9816_length_2333_cov_19.949013_1_plen_82_part_00
MLSEEISPGHSDFRPAIDRSNGSKVKVDQTNERVALSDIESLYAAIPYLSRIADDGGGDEMDRVVVERTIDMLNSVSVRFA